MQTSPLVTPGTSAIAERPATGNHQELKRTPATARMPATVWMQAIAVTQATKVTVPLVSLCSTCQREKV
jgi:hypothetical protein